MELSPGDIFDAETDPVPENVTAELQRQSYSPRQCELVTRSCDLVSPDPEQFYSLKLAGDHAYLVRDYKRAVELYEKYLRKVLDNGQPTPLCSVHVLVSQFCFTLCSVSFFYRAHYS